MLRLHTAAPFNFSISSTLRYVIFLVISFKMRYTPLKKIMNSFPSRIGICGGGSLAHAMAAWLSRSGHGVRIVTRRPEAWGNTLLGHFFDGKDTEVPLLSVSADMGTLADCGVIFVTGPRFAIRPLCTALHPHLRHDQLVVIVPGTPEVGHMENAPEWKEQPMMALYKVPLVCRTAVYGHAVQVLGSRALNRVWVSPAAQDDDTAMLETMFETPLVRLSSTWPFLLTNSNPLLHPSRMTCLFADYDEGVTYERQFLFYEEWGIESSELYLAADAELLRICEQCPGMSIGTDILPVTEYYESADAAALTRKLRSIESLKGIGAPMVRLGERWIPDFSSRYFTEDIPYGTAPICDYARTLNIDTPVLDRFVAWNTSMLQRFAKQG